MMGVPVKPAVSVIRFVVFGAVLAHPVLTPPAGAQAHLGARRTVFASVVAGGYQQESALTSAVPTLERLAREIANQYEITYSLVEGARPSDRLELTTTRKNVTLRAPQKIPN